MAQGNSSCRCSRVRTVEGCQLATSRMVISSGLMLLPLTCWQVLSLLWRLLESRAGPRARAAMAAAAAAAAAAVCDAPAAAVCDAPAFDLLVGAVAAVEAAGEQGWSPS